MANPTDELRKAYFTALEGNIIVNAIEVPIYDGMNPYGTDELFIVLSERDAVQQDGKNCFNYQCTFLVDCIVKNSNFGYATSEAIANEVLTLINSDIILTMNNFQMASTEVTSKFNLSALNEDDNVFRTLIRFSHILHQI